MIGAVVWWAMGYGFAFGDERQFIGDNYYFYKNVNQCDGSFWFYQWTFAATCSTIISGAMAGRTNLVAYFVYSVVVTGFIYPVVVHWTWSDNAWLADRGYLDFAGSGIVHVTGGIAAMIGAYMVGPRDIRAWRASTPPGTPTTNVPNLSPAQIHRMVATNHSMPLVALGTIILIFGFFGFNGGSVLSMDSAADGRAMGVAVISTVMAASGGSLSASAANYAMNKRWSLVQACNGCIAGMVAICASADRVDTWAAWVIGIGGGLSFRLWSWAIKKAGIDDAVDAAAVHAGAGIWGVIAAPIFDNSLGIFYQDLGRDAAWNAFGWHLLGVTIIVSWTAATSFIMFGVLAAVDMLRVTDQSLQVGLDKHEHGEWAYGYDKREIIDESGKASAADASAPSDIEKKASEDVQQNAQYAHALGNFNSGGFRDQRGLGLQSSTMGMTTQIV